MVTLEEQRLRKGGSDQSGRWQKDQSDVVGYLSGQENVEFRAGSVDRDDFLRRPDSSHGRDGVLLLEQRVMSLHDGGDNYRLGSFQVNVVDHQTMLLGFFLFLNQIEFWFVEDQRNFNVGSGREKFVGGAQIHVQGHDYFEFVPLVSDHVPSVPAVGAE